MALTGTLLADFSAFTNEAAKATTAVKTMETGADTAAAKLSKIGADVNIQSTLTDPLKTATQAITGAADAMGPAAVAAVGYATGISAVGVALFELATSSAETLAHLGDVATVTGLTVPEVSRLANAATVAGTDLGSLNNALFTMNQRLAEHPDQVEKGLERINLHLADFKALAPVDRLTAFATALEATDDPLQRTAAGTEIMGRQFREQEPALLNLNKALAMTADIPVWTDAQAKQAEQFQMDLASIEVHGKALALQFGQPLIGPIDTFVQHLSAAAPYIQDWLVGLGGIGPMLDTAANAYSTASAAVEVFRGKASEIPAVTGPAAQGVKDWNATIDWMKLNVPSATDAITAQKEVLKDHSAQVAKSTDTTKAWVTANEAVNASYVTWQDTLATVDTALQEDIKIALASGVSQHDLATAWGLTAAQVKAVAISLEDYATAMTKTADLEKAELARRTEIEQAMTKATNQRILDTLAAQQQEDAFLKANLADAQLQDAIQQGVKTTTKTVTDSADVIGTAFTTHFKAAQDSFEQFQGVVVAGTAEMIAGLTSFHDSGAYVQMQKDMRDAQNARGGFYIDTGFAPAPTQTRDSGGPVVAGQSYLIGGGKAPEIFTPGASGFVTPGGRAGGGTVQNIYITQPLGTPEAIARAVADAQVALMRGQGVRLPYGT